MDKLRDFMKSKLGIALLLLCLAPMAFLGIADFGGGSMTPDTVVRVGKKDVSLSTLQSEMTNTRSQLLAQNDASMIDEVALQNQTLDTVVNRTLIEEQSRKLGMAASDETISRLLAQQSSFLDANGQFSNELFAMYLRQSGMTRDSLLAAFGIDLAMRQLMGSILSTAIYPSGQVNRLIDLQLESRMLWARRLAWQDYADKVAVSDDEIAAYYDTHKAELVNEERVDISYIKLTTDNVKAGEITPEDLNAAYKRYLTDKGLNQGYELAQILLTGDNAQAQAEKAKAELADGKSFAEVAKAYSEDLSADNGGKIGKFNPAVFGADAAVVETALQNLKVGESSEVVVTSFGRQIFQVIAMADVPSLESVKDEVTRLAVAEKRANALSEQVANINNMSDDGLGVVDIAKQAGLTAQTIKNYPRTNNRTALPQPAVIAAAFDEFTISDQGVSVNIDLADGVVWVQPSNHRLAVPMTLAEASPIVKDILIKQKASELALVDAKKMAAAVDNGDMNGLSALGIVSRANPAVSRSEAASLFATNAPENKVIGWSVLTDEGATVFAGGSITREQQSRMSDVEKAQAATMMKDVLAQDYLEDYLLYLRSVHGVEINEQSSMNVGVQSSHGM
ncbi:MAG: SurA N-terminal domain-containing protein [Moraxella sp.]|nr:SurA N-terminal domain-containing protein [Moraxella sp.]